MLLCDERLDVMLLLLLLLLLFDLRLETAVKSNNITKYPSISLHQVGSSGKAGGGGIFSNVLVSIIHQLGGNNKNLEHFLCLSKYIFHSKPSNSPA